ncbi:MAG: hypothetical protein ABS81_16795 [Pseudonocardia sp. SCN 72-86]|nr:MAG: hypothetical protein ABS81_16795 [Pseudonocardia sp. SCN 72-86]
MRPAAINSSLSVRTVVGVLLLTQAVTAAAAVRAADALPFGAALAAVVAVAMAVVLLRRPVDGPDIHDRQLDLILVAGGAVAVGVLAVAQLTGSAHELGLLAAAPAAIAALATTVGTRWLWQLRGVPVVLAAGWPGPWSGFAPVVPVAVVVAVTAAILLRGALRSRAAPRGPPSTSFRDEGRRVPRRRQVVLRLDVVGGLRPPVSGNSRYRDYCHSRPIRRQEYQVGSGSSSRSRCAPTSRRL